MAADYSVDVIVVNYNAGAYLQRCVQSVLKSELLVNLWVVDNCSSDQSMDAIAQLDAGGHRVQALMNTENVGFAKAVNQAADLGQGRYIFLLNPDCELYPHTIANLAAELEAHPDAGVLGALVFNEDGSEQRGCRRLEPTFTRSMVTALRLDKHFTSVNLQHAPLPEDTLAIDAVSGSAMMIKRACFEAIDGMDEGYFLHVEDLDFCRRVREAGQQVLFTPKVSLFHCQGVSTSKVPYRMEWHKTQGMLRYHSKYQQPHQNFLRSFFSRGVIGLNYLLSVTRHLLRGKRTSSVNHAPKSFTALYQGMTVMTGASSDLGQAMLESMIDEPLPVVAVTRQRIPARGVGNELWLNWGYFEKVPTSDLGPIADWISLSPIWSAPVIAQVLHRSGAPKRVIALSSTSVQGKGQSTDPREQAVVKALLDGEQQLLNWSDQLGVDTTIARSSMIYGGEHNKNINLIRRLIKVFRFFPLVGDGSAKRQPVHIEDLSRAIVQLRAKGQLPALRYDLAGAEQLSYRQMVERVFTAANQQPRFVKLPDWLLRCAVSGLSKLPGLSFINAALLARMQDDLSYDIEPAQRDFGYAPGPFRP